MIMLFPALDAGIGHVTATVLMILTVFQYLQTDSFKKRRLLLAAFLLLVLLLGRDTKVVSLLSCATAVVSRAATIGIFICTTGYITQLLKENALNLENIFKENVIPPDRTIRWIVKAAILSTSINYTIVLVVDDLRAELSAKAILILSLLAMFSVFLTRIKHLSAFAPRIPIPDEKNSLSKQGQDVNNLIAAQQNIILKIRTTTALVLRQLQVGSGLVLASIIPIGFDLYLSWLRLQKQLRHQDKRYWTASEPEHDELFYTLQFTVPLFLLWYTWIPINNRNEGFGDSPKKSRRRRPIKFHH